MNKAVSTLCAIAGTAVLCQGAFAGTPTISSKPFGNLPDGRPTTLYTLTNSKGVTATITNYGGILTSLKTPDRTGSLGDIVLGYDSIKPYGEALGGTYFGALIGRYGNRIAKGKFTLDGKTYHLAINNPPNTLHGGKVGYDKKIWTAKEIQGSDSVGLDLTYFSKDGEEGYPGNLNVHVIYTLTNDNSLKIDYSAVTDKDTVLNLTHHSYFNLDGAGNGTILGQKLTLFASAFTPIDATSIPTGVIEPVAGTPFDFRHSTAIGARIDRNDKQLKNGHGYDHNFVLRPHGHRLVLAAIAYSPKSGRVLETFTTQPGVQFYTSNFLDGTITGKYGRKYPKHAAFCLETQDFPDAPNKPNFPSSELKPGEVYSQHTVYHFAVR
jgi:aldose 1-epimerase